MIKLEKTFLQQTAKLALTEDLGGRFDLTADITSQAVIPPEQHSTAQIISHQNGVLAGIDIALACFQCCAQNIDITQHSKDGALIKTKDIIATIYGNTQAILAAERTALNFLSHLSGIATHTQDFVARTKNTKTKITCTRKTTPHLRLLEKYAVLQGGGTPHRLSLKDGILIKDNHIIKAGSIIYAITQAKQKHPNKQIEIEIDTPAQIEDAIQAGADRILLDNMDIKTLTKAIELIKGRTLIEVSGNIELNNIAKIAQLGVDYISVGALTHSAPILDMGLDFPPSHPTQK